MSSSIHTVNAEEVRIWTELVNQTLAGDSECHPPLPINPTSEDIFAAVQNGLILWYVDHCHTARESCASISITNTLGTTVLHWVVFGSNQAN
jgi:hypothetical protein